MHPGPRVESRGPEYITVLERNFAGPRAKSRGAEFRIKSKKCNRNRMFRKGFFRGGKKLKTDWEICGIIV